VKATDFGLPPETAEKLFESGRRAAITFLDGDDEYPAWNFERYKEHFRRPSGKPAATGAVDESTLVNIARHNPAPSALAL